MIASIVQMAALSQDVMDRLAVVDVETLAAGHLEALRIDAQLMQHCRVDIRNVVPVFHRVKANFVRSAMHHAGLDPATGQP